MEQMTAAFACGWFDDAPAAVLEERDRVIERTQILDISFEMRKQGETKGVGGLCRAWADANPESPASLIAGIFGGLGRVVQWASEPDTDSVTLLFINTKASTFSLSPRPPAIRLEPTSIPNATRAFATAVSESIQGGVGMWSRCEWATLELKRQMR